MDGKIRSRWYVVLLLVVTAIGYSEGDVLIEAIPYSMFNNILEDVRKDNPTFADLEPMAIPEFMKGSEDENIKQAVKHMESMNEILNNPLGVKEQTLREGEYDKGCQTMPTPIGNVTHCNYGWTENDGKLNIHVLVIIGPEGIEWRTTFDGVDEYGIVYNNMLRQWIMHGSDGSYRSNYYQKIDRNLPGCSKPECGEGLLFVFTWGKDEDSLTMATRETWGCGIIECFYHPNIRVETRFIEDDCINFKTHNWDMNRDRLYLWIDYTACPDGSWSKIVYDEYGRVEKFEQWPPPEQ